jgi:hypothetical protein
MFVAVAAALSVASVAAAAHGNAGAGALLHSYGSPSALPFLPTFPIHRTLSSHARPTAGSTVVLLGGTKRVPNRTLL